jgi:N utilization substance protein B
VAFGGSRREARERALSLLYEADAKSLPVADVIADLPVPPDEFAADVAEGVIANLDEVDDLIRRFARDWKLERMPVVDRTLLRMGVYELAHRPDVPTGVVVSEAVDLASQYSTDDSGKFVNGVLSAVAREVRPSG